MLSENVYRDEKAIKIIALELDMCQLYKENVYLSKR